MPFIERVKALLGGSKPSGKPMLSRRQRREIARGRHHETGEAAWSVKDRHLGPEGRREVQDVAPGTPGAGGSHRIIE